MSTKLDNLDAEPNETLGLDGSVFRMYKTLKSVKVDATSSTCRANVEQR